MPTLTRPPTWNAISESYGVTRQQLWELRRKYPIDYDVLLDPDRVFEILLDHAPASPLRSRLTDPRLRAAIKRELS